MKEEIKLTFGIIKNDPWFIVQCLEYDFGTEAKSIHDLYYYIEKSIVAEFHLRRKLNSNMNATPEDVKNKFLKENHIISYLLTITEIYYELVNEQTKKLNIWKAGVAIRAGM